jgi:ferredoxin-NADP reductase
VRSVVYDTPGSAIVEFEVPARLRSRFEFAAGQHVVIRGAHDGEPIRRSYSLCDEAGSDRVRIALRRHERGAFSSHVFERRITGTALYVSEPAGTFTPDLDPTARHRYAAVAAGSGITPIVSIVATVLAAEPYSTVTLHYGSRDHTHIMLAARIRELMGRYPGRLRVVHHLSRQRAGLRPDPQGPAYWYRRIDPVEIARTDADRWFLCGPKALVAATVTALRARGVAGRGSAPSCSRPGHPGHLGRAGRPAGSPSPDTVSRWNSRCRGSIRSWTRPSPGARTCPTPVSAAPAAPASPRSRAERSRWIPIRCRR